MQAIPPRKDGRGCSSHMPSSRRTEQARSRDQETSASCAPTASVRVVKKTSRLSTVLPREYSLAATKAGRPVDGCEGDKRIRSSYDVVKRYSAVIAPRRHTVYRPASARSTGGV